LRALIERPYSCLPQAVGAVYDRAILSRTIRAGFGIFYGGGNGGGDFTTWVQGNTSAAFVAFPYAPRGEVLDTYLAKVPLSLLQPQDHLRSSR
jgi:hypothetical protein